MADQDSSALTHKIGPLPVWVWMALVFVLAMVFSYAKKGAGKGAIDPQTGLPMGSAADQQALQQLQQIGSAAQRGASSSGSQTPPTIIQNYPASTTVTTAFPLHGSAFGNNGSPSWAVKAPRARKGGPGPRGPGHKPWERGDQGFNGGEPHHPGGGPGAGPGPGRGDHQGQDGGHGGDQDHPGGRPGWGGKQSQGGGFHGGPGGPPGPGGGHGGPPGRGGPRPGGPGGGGHGRH